MQTLVTLVFNWIDIQFSGLLFAFKMQFIFLSFEQKFHFTNGLKVWGKPKKYMKDIKVIEEY